MITGTERLQAAVEGRASDRIPVFCNLLDQGAKELGRDGRRSFFIWDSSDAVEHT